MQKWILKAIIQKGISWLPASHRVNFWFQKNITKGVHLDDEHFHDKLTHCSDHLAFFPAERSLAESTVFELGTGWYPVVPIGFFLSGAKQIYSIDISALCTKERLLDTVDQYIAWQKRGSLPFYLPDVKPERWDTLTTLDRSLSFSDLLKTLHLELIVGDARSMSLPDNSIDYAVSNNVLEHIYPHLLRDILVEIDRTVKPGALQSHFIDMSDHFAHSDTSISVYNYLKFSPSQWKWIDNDVQPQNRMRLPEYLALFDQLELKATLQRTRKGNVSTLEKTGIHGDYKRFPADEAAVTHTHAVLKNSRYYSPQ